MASLLQLSKLPEYSADDLQVVIDDAPRVRTLREAVGLMVRSIHGLPRALDCELQQVDIYIGRTGSEANLLRNRWRIHEERFEHKPSTHAFVALRGSTETIRNQQWETKAQRLVQALIEHKALCCENAALGTCGRWPGTDDTALYVVARVRQGQAGRGAAAQDVNRAMIDILNDDHFRDDVARYAAKAIATTGDFEEHEFLLPPVDQSTGQSAEPAQCKVCNSCRAWPGNYGFCRRCRTPDRVPRRDRCKVCDRPKLRGNYGFCGYHRKA